LASWTSGENYLHAVKDGRVALYYNNVAKLETTNTGVKIDNSSTTDMLLLDVGGTNFAKIGHNTASGTALLDIRSEGHTRFLTGGNNERIRITSGGICNIGTNNQASGHSSSKLRVGTASGSDQGIVVFGNADTTTPALIITNWDGSQTQNKSVIHFDNSGWGSFQIGCTAGADAFGIFDDGTERLRIHSSGDVDIKHETTTKFQSTANVCNLRLQSSASGTANSDGIAIQMDSSRNMYLHLYETGDMIFGTSNLERMRITSAGKITMSQGGTVELQTHMMRVGNRTTSQINAGISTSTGALTLDTTTNNLKYYANSQWSTVKKIGNDGSTQTLAARSAKALMDDGQTTSGVYWLDMHGGYSAGNAKRHYCLQDSSYDGGGWTMLYAMNHGNNFASGSNYTFSVNVGSPTSASDFTAGNWGYDRRNTFTPAANDQFLIRRSDNNDWRRFVVTAWSPTSNSVSNGWETLNNPSGSNQGHPFYATGQMYDSSGNSVSGYIYFNGCAKGGSCNSGGGDGSGFGNYQAWLWGAGGYAAYGGGYNSVSAGGSPLYWGTSALSQGGSLYLQMFYRKSGTQ